ncbi:MAG: HlyD family efflux transporter periplasmic adaptor subunit [Gammaproteobacteria bacterium]|nr:HlyD family efflux transporter periplasmic adaptor subunit [Gammaproteobacteria bacterium]
MRFLLTLLLCFVSTQAIAIDLNGHTEFAQRMALNSSISARVKTIHVAAGDQVVAGEVLLTLVSTGLQANVDIAQAKVHSLAPILEKMQTELEKAQELFDRDSLALVELGNAEQNHAIAGANLAAANARLVRALFHLSQAELRSPINGVVLSIDSFAGQFINTRDGYQPLLTVVDSSSMIVRATLPLELWSNSLLKRSARVRFQKQIFKGEVVEIGSQVNVGDNNHPSVSLLVKFKTGGKLPAGLPVIVNLANN